MKLDAVKLGMAASIVAAASWVICSLLVFAAPARMMNMSGHMVHANLADMQWTLTGSGFFVGLIAWSLLSGIIIWAVAAIYNRMLS